MWAAIKEITTMHHNKKAESKVGSRIAVDHNAKLQQSDERQNICLNTTHTSLPMTEGVT